MGVEVIVPVAMFLSIVAIIWLFSHFNYKKRQSLFDAIRYVVDKGEDPSGEMRQNLIIQSDPVRADLRKGILFLAVGFAFLLLGMMVGFEEGEALGPIIGVASFPIFLGLAYLGLWKFGRGGRSA